MGVHSGVEFFILKSIIFFVVGKKLVEVRKNERKKLIVGAMFLWGFLVFFFWCPFFCFMLFWCLENLGDFYTERFLLGFI